MTTSIITKVLSEKSFEWLEGNNISFHNRSGSRLRPGDEICYLSGLEIEPYVGFYAGNHLFQQGYMSYSNSHLPLDLTIGRYCSVAWAINFIAYDHPWKCLSTSIFTHDQETDLTQRALRDFVDTSKPIQFAPNP